MLKQKQINIIEVNLPNNNAKAYNKINVCSSLLDNENEKEVQQTSVVNNSEEEYNEDGIHNADSDIADVNRNESTKAANIHA